MAKPRIGRKKEGFKEFLQRVSNIDPDAPDSELFELNQRSKELDVISHGFRYHSLRTQLREDAHLSLYRQWASIVLAESQTNGELGDDDLDRLCFPDPSSDSSQPWAGLQSQLRRFLVFALEKCVPRSISDDSISYQTLVQYRHSMIFWVLRKYPERSIEPPKRVWLEATMLEMMRSLQARFKIRTHRTSAMNSTRVGTWEILQMMDFDLRETPCIELAECHHLAWVLARLAALRPGSLGSPGKVGDHHLPFLAWGDVQIERTTTVGVFYVQLTIRNLKRKLNDPEDGHKYNPLILSLHSPKGKIAFELSAPHRLLTIALRRGVLVGIETLDDLFTQPQRYILIKDEFKDQPILLQGGNRGLTVENKPMTAFALTEYLQLRGKKIGLTKSITFYSIRRNTAIDLSTKLGSEMARAIMAHDPDSTTMETYYTAGRTAIPDLTSVALGTMSGDTDNQPIDGSLAFSRLDNEQMRKFGPLLNSLFLELLEMDDDYPHDGDKRTQKNRDRVLRRAALRATMQQLYEEQRKSATVDATKLKIDELQSMCNEFNQRVLDAAKQSISNGHSSRAVDDGPADGNESSLDPSGIDLNVDFPENNLETPEQDAEDQFQTQIEQNQTVNTFPEELPSSIDQQLSDVDYATVARAAMEIWLNVGMEGSAFGHQKGAQVICHRCQDDDTVDANVKAKTWAPSRLPRHLPSSFHSNYERFLRRAVKKAKEENLDGLRCEICVAIAPPGTFIPYHSTKRTLTRHIEESHSTRLSTAEGTVDAWWSTKSEKDKQEIFAAHDRVKTEIGWYKPDFRGNIKHKAKAKAESRRRDYRQLSFEFSGHQELPRPIPIGHGLQRGSTPGWFGEFLDSNPTASSMVTMSDIPTLGDVTGMKDEILQTPSLASQITFHTLDERPPVQFSPRFAHLVQFGPIPGSPDYPSNAENILDKWERESKMYGSSGRRL